MASVPDLPDLSPEGSRTKGVGKRLLTRMRTALRKSDSSKRQSIMSSTEMSDPIPSYTVAGPSIAPMAPDSRQSTPPLLPHQQVTEGAFHTRHGTSPETQIERVPRAQIYEERLKRFSQRCNLDPETDLHYPTEGYVLRVSKQPRMRIHRQCHECGSEVNTRGLCAKCNHSFCPECTRYPRKQTEAEMAANRDAKNAILESCPAKATIVPDWNAGSNPIPIVRLPPRQAQQELVYRKVRQRVRRTCCQCQEERGDEVLFRANQRCCPKCNHVRCTDCPRDPCKKDKYPYGYPGDAFGAKTVPHHRCHTCRTMFPPNVENGASCANCNHQKCDACPRLVPQKFEPEPNPEVVKSVQQKLANLGSSKFSPPMA